MHNTVDVMITCVGLIFDDSLFVDIISKLVELIEYYVEIKINECGCYYNVVDLTISLTLYYIAK